MKPKIPHCEYWTIAQLKEYLGVDRKTIYRFRNVPRIIDRGKGPEAVLLHAINTSGSRSQGKVLIPLSHKSKGPAGTILLGVFEFIDALGTDPVLAGIEAGMLEL